MYGPCGMQYRVGLGSQRSCIVTHVELNVLSLSGLGAIYEMDDIFHCMPVCGFTFNHFSAKASRMMREHVSGTCLAI